MTGSLPVLAAAPPLEEGLVQTAIVLVAVSIAWVAINHSVRRVLRRVKDRALEAGTLHEAERVQRLTTLWSVARILLLIILLVALTLLVLSVWGLPIAPFLAVGSVLGVAVGFGAQDLVKNVIAGIFIVAEDQYGLDDIVQLGEVAGKVEEIRLRTTVLRDLDGNVHHVPNGTITVATNYTQVFANAVVDLDVAYESDIDHVLAVVGEEALRFRNEPERAGIVLDDPEVLGVEELGESSIRVRVMFKVVAEERWGIRREFLRRIKGVFDAEGIKIPFPHVSVVMERRGDDPDPGPLGGGAKASKEPGGDDAPGAAGDGDGGPGEG